MDKQTEALKLALEALENAWLDASMGKGDVARHTEAITAIREALAEQSAQHQEPTKAMIDAAERIDWSDSDVCGNIINMWQAMCAAAPQPAQQQEPVGKFKKAEHGNYPVLEWKAGYVAKIGDVIYTSPQPAHQAFLAAKRQLHEGNTL